MDKILIQGNISIRVLVVDDDENWVKSFSQQVKNDTNFFEFIYAPNLQVALELLSTQSFQLILTDIMLPDSKGVKTIESITAKAKFVPIVVITNTEDVAVQEDSMSLGVEDYLVKGQHDLKTFNHVVHQAIRRSSAKLGITKDLIDKLKAIQECLSKIMEK